MHQCQPDHSDKTNVVNAQRQIDPTFVLAFAFSASKSTQLPTTTTIRSLFPINPMELLSTSRANKRATLSFDALLPLHFRRNWQRGALIASGQLRRRCVWEWSTTSRVTRTRCSGQLR
ncbi:hypothetical protein T01_6872 [Trichinella spiralis]|uniref:Uncharacterized protein n=1 Tax=Trichinella spiralis TaxID=6334 RepID=A0A0V1BAI2_TRISP|nr:hypothetical protein T01_6872 [Trichinella spiralis]